MQTPKLTATVCENNRPRWLLPGGFIFDTQIALAPAFLLLEASIT